MTGGIWTRDTIGWILVAALLPVLVGLALEQDAAGLARVATGLVVIGFWQGVFLSTRGQPLSAAGAVTAVAVAVLAPGELAIWQLVLALTFGTVIGEMIFGGWGRNVFSSGVVTLAFLFFSFPEVQHDPAGLWIAYACIPAGLLLLVTGILSWRVALAAAVGFAAVVAATGYGWPPASMAGTAAFGLVFLIGDPVSSASTNPGRLIYGALAGALTALFGWDDTGAGAAQSLVSATLLASIFAPLIDHLVIAAKSELRGRRHG